MLIDQNIETIIQRALKGEKIPAAKLEPLFALDENSAEAAMLTWAAQTIGRKASNNTGQVYAQIGIDALPCKVNCAFCSLAEQSSDGGAYDDAIVPLEEVVRYAVAFDKANVHLISLMATESLGFDRCLETLKAVRAAVSPDMPIMINFADLSPQQAQACKDAGASIAYHALRMGEGEVTRIKPEARLRTIENIRDAGMHLMTAVEPIHALYSAAEILERMELCASMKPYCSGVDPLTPVKGTVFENTPTITRKRAGMYAAIMRLLVGTDIPYGTGSGNVVWVDAGTNPRGRSLPVDDDHLARYVALQKKTLLIQGWEVSDRPLSFWFN